MDMISIETYSIEPITVNKDLSTQLAVIIKLKNSLKNKSNKICIYITEKLCWLRESILIVKWL
jgi:hypothetical protein